MGNDQDFEKSVKSSLKKYLGDKEEKYDGRTKLEILSNCSDDSVIETSDSYEMVEYGLSPLEMKALKQARRKSCLCWHPDVIFNDKGDSESEDTFPQDFIARLDYYYIESEVMTHFFVLFMYFKHISESPICGSDDYWFSYCGHLFINLLPFLVSELWKWSSSK